MKNAFPVAFPPKNSGVSSIQNANFGGVSSILTSGRYPTIFYIMEGMTP